MRSLALVVVGACVHASVPLPATPTQTDPTLGISPASTPSGEPVEITAQPFAVGTVAVVSGAETELLRIRLDDGGGKRQSRKMDYRARAKILAVAGALATKVEVIVDTVTAVVQVETNRDRSELLHGAYIVTRADVGLTAARPDGTAVDQGEVASLELVVGPLMLGDETFDTLVDHKLRVGETVPIRGPDLEHELYGAPPVGATSTLSLLRATAELATYQLDYKAKGTEPNLIGDIELKGRRTVVVDRVRGQIVDDQLVTFKTERGKGREVGTSVEQSRRVAF